MTQAARILIVTNGHLCRNPRVCKEATSLGAAGYDVTVLGVCNHPPSETLDASLRAGAPFRSEGLDLLPGRGPAAFRLRDIEAPMGGVCYLAEWTTGIDDLYEPGPEIEAYNDAAELDAKATALVGDVDGRKKLRLAGQQRAQRDHTIARTLERILQHR